MDSINTDVFAFGLLLALITVPIYMEGKSYIHLYAIIFTKILTLVGIAVISRPSATPLVCAILALTEGSYVASWLLGIGGDWLKRWWVLRNWRKQKTG